MIRQLEKVIAEALLDWLNEARMESSPAVRVGRANPTDFPDALGASGTRSGCKVWGRSDAR